MELEEVGGKMPKFEIVSLEEALEATKTGRWLEAQFGVELEEVHDSKRGLTESNGPFQTLHPPEARNPTLLT